jgi:hypothetical protein
MCLCARLGAVCWNQAYLDKLPDRLLRGFESYLTEQKNAGRGLVLRTLDFLKSSANDLLLQCHNSALVSFNTLRGRGRL